MVFPFFFIAVRCIFLFLATGWANNLYFGAKKVMVEEIVLRCAMGREFLYRPDVAVQLLEKYGSVENLIAGRGDEGLRGMEELLGRVVSPDSLRWAEDEIEWCGKKGVKLIFYGERGYPEALAEQPCPPFMLYYKGCADLNHPRSVSIVGTRLASEYGREGCNMVVEHLRSYSPLIVSGLAYGIDIASHKAALENGLQTVAVLPNGLDMIYPSRHRDIAVQMVSQGGLLTEFPRGTAPQKPNFVKRNRIIAAISQALVVVESRIKGGSMITAEFACSYNKDIFALPGRITDTNSFGCNYLIARNVAAIYNSPAAIPSALGWEGDILQDMAYQPELFSYDVENKEKILLTLKFDKPTGIDEICNVTGLDWGTASTLLLELELEGRIKVTGNTDYCLKR